MDDAGIRRSHRIVLRGAIVDDQTFIENDGPRCGSQTLIQVMRGEYDRLSGSNGVIEKTVQGLCGFRVKSRVRLIEEESERDHEEGLSRCRRVVACHARTSEQCRWHGA
jgi:hypothetical protein